MSSTVRQSNIFGTYDWKVAYDSFLEADFESYDYDTIYHSMVEYIKRHYADDFNDYIQHSELLVHVNMLSFLGQGYSLRNDVNATNNFIDDADRRQSIINIARTLNYRPKRNIPAHGSLKIDSVETTEKIYNSNGSNISNDRVFWNEKGNHTWYDSYIKIIESAFKSKHKFGHPSKEHRSSNTRLELYELSQREEQSYVYPFFDSINGVQYRFEIVPTDIDEGALFERFPSTENPFTLLYRNDQTGNNSPTTGFFVQFKQGELMNRDFYYETPKTDRSEIIDVENVNDNDVWVQEIHEDGSLKHYWYDIPKGTGQNIVYSSSQLDERKLYFSKTQTHDKVEILYGDGNFSISPTKNMRVWVRQSSNTEYKILAREFHDISVKIPYVDGNGRDQTLTLHLVNEEDITNAEVSESLEDIKKNAISNYFNQDRMVSIEDYNIFPFERNPLRKIKVVNRDNSGKTRYPQLQTHDPTGMHSNVFVNAVDGYVFEQYYPIKSKVVTDHLYNNKDTLPHIAIEEMIKDPFFRLFYHHTMFVENYKNDPASYTLAESSPRLYWKNQYVGTTSRKGSIKFKTYDDTGAMNWDTFELKSISQIREYSKMLFLHGDKQYWTTVTQINENTITVSDHIPSNAYLYLIFPNVPWTLSESIKKKVALLVDKEESFGIRFNDISGTWHLINQDNIVDTGELYENEKPKSNLMPDNRWLIRGEYVREDDGNYYLLEVRGLRLCLGSDKQIRFFFNNMDYVSDVHTGLPVIDKVNIIQDDETYGMSSLKPKHHKYITNRNITIQYLE